ncbi:MAG TPA: 7-carboxy-7-deazaguanine synthase QueE [Prevotellaceae bacterium]|nr:7-carboxy-7-deazaguanine synthase QueE [Prevotellaceae bacterium]
MRVNEIFYSLQGEGYFTGTPAVFVRFSGCNLSCSFCDTEHTSFTEMSEEDIVREVCAYPAAHVVITGGEPTMQLTASLVDRLHAAGKYVQIETNGTYPLPEGCRVDWITCSPKYRPVVLTHIDELKVVFQTPEQDMSQYDGMEAQVYSLQPCDVNDDRRNAVILKDAVEYCLSHPKWRLSLQTHKIINVR